MKVDGCWPRNSDMIGARDMRRRIKMRCERYTGVDVGVQISVEAAHVGDMACAFLCMATLCSVMAKCNTVRGRGHVRLLAKSSKCSLCG